MRGVDGQANKVDRRRGGLIGEQAGVKAIRG